MNLNVRGVAYAALFVVVIVAASTYVFVVGVSKNHGLTDAERIDIRDELSRLVKKENPREALRHLKSISSVDTALLNECHGFVHDIGHDSYERYKDVAEAARYHDDFCNAGYLHGVLESYFSGVSDPLARLNSVCDSYPNGTYLSWQCYHGVGHGLMYYTENDLSHSLSLCNNFTERFALRACVNGVFMENFSAGDDIHRSEYVNSENPLAPCESQTDSNKNDCYLYAPTYYLRLHPRAYDDALNLCDSAETAYQYACVEGVGSEAMKQNLDDPAYVYSMCVHARDEHVSPCIRGMSILPLYHYGALEPALVLCNALDTEHQSLCVETVMSHASLFEP